MGDEDRETENLDVSGGAIMKALIFTFLIICCFALPVSFNGWLGPLDTYGQLKTLQSEVYPQLFDAIRSLKANSPETIDYSVLSWWDYGHGIIYIANRKPVTSPTNQFSDVQMFFGAPTIKEAESYLENTDVKYILITREMVTVFFQTVYVGMPKHPLQRPFPEAMDDKKQACVNSMVYKFWTEQPIDGYVLRYKNDSVKIWEVIK